MQYTRKDGLVFLDIQMSTKTYHEFEEFLRLNMMVPVVHGTKLPLGNAIFSAAFPSNAAEKIEVWLKEHDVNLV